MDELYNSEVGEKILLAVSKAKQNRCFACNTKENLTIHHMIPMCKGGMDIQDNRVRLCRNCHDMVHYSRATVQSIKVRSTNSLTNIELLQRLLDLKEYKRLSLKFAWIKREGFIQKA